MTSNIDIFVYSVSQPDEVQIHGLSPYVARAMCPSLSRETLYVFKYKSYRQIIVKFKKHNSP